MDDSKIDLVRYGVLWQKVEGYEKQFEIMSKKMDKMEEQLEKLLDAHNQQKGVAWVGIGLMSIFSTLGGWFLHWWSKG